MERDRQPEEPDFAFSAGNAEFHAKRDNTVVRVYEKQPQFDHMLIVAEDKKGKKERLQIFRDNFGNQFDEVIEYFRNNKYPYIQDYLETAPYEIREWYYDNHPVEEELSRGDENTARFGEYLVEHFVSYPDDMKEI